MMDVTGAKDLYENFDVIAGNMNDEMGADGDMFANVLLAMTGMVRQYDTGTVGLDVRARDQANRVAIRWLRTNGYLARR